jgi:hypothetical protein
MAKEYYDVSYKTFFNARIKQTVFQGKETWPLYVQVTYDRKTIFFKSYYFDLFAQPKYNFLQMPLFQVDELESRVAEFSVKWDAKRFDLDIFSRRYKVFSIDILDSFDGRFKIWLANYFQQEGWSGLAAAVAQSNDGVAAIQLWDDLKKCMEPGIFEKMEEKAARDGGPYLPLATYIRHKLPKGPFCLPLHEWSHQEKQIEIEDFIDERFWRVDMGQIWRAVRDLLHPIGYGYL